MRILRWGAINPLTGQPYTWGDPNLRWGSPSYALEPGDPGFVPYPDQLPTKPKTKTRRMKHNDWYPIRHADQITWLGNFVSKLPGRATELNVSNATRDARIADARWVAHVMGTWLPAVRSYQQACTQSLQTVLFGTSATAVLPVFTPPALPGATTDPVLPAVVPVAEGALDRIFDFINSLQPIASMEAKEDLRMIGPETQGPDFETFGPKLKVNKTNTGVEIEWGWQGYRDFLDQCEIEVDRGDGQGWRFLTIDSTPGYTDSHPFPAQLTKWKYRAIYRVGDSRIGQWSAVTEKTEVTVGG